MYKIVDYKHASVTESPMNLLFFLFKDSISSEEHGGSPAP